MQTSGSGVRLFVEEDLTRSARISLPDAQSHYLVSVMRVRVGDTIALFNGRDGEWQADIVRAGKHECIVNVERRLRPQRAEAGPSLAFAPLKKACTQFVVEKATELGVSGLLPVFTRRTTTDRVNLRRLRAHAIEAAEQSRRLTLPAISTPVRLSELLGDWSAERRLFVLDCSGRGEPLLGALLADRTRGEGRLDWSPGFLVGPEGGLSETELDDLASLPFAAFVSLGSRILRAETAALAALACWQAVAGDLAPPLPS